MKRLLVRSGSLMALYFACAAAACGGSAPTPQTPPPAPATAVPAPVAGSPSPAAAVTSPSDAAIRNALANPARTDKERARDAARHPAETLAFFGVRGYFSLARWIELAVEIEKACHFVKMIHVAPPVATCVAAPRSSRMSRNWWRARNSTTPTKLRRTPRVVAMSS